MKCKDWYGKELKIGDMVIPMCSEACICNVSGEIKNITDDGKWIDIFDSNKNKLIEKWNALYFSTQDRFDEFE